MTKPKMKRLLQETQIPDKLTIRDVYLYISDTNQRIDNFERRTRRIAKHTEVLSNEAAATLDKVTHLVHGVMERIATWEESMLYIMHNIKKNQFLYANYPDEWVKSYADIKKGLRNENDYMDQKIAQGE